VSLEIKIKHWCYATIWYELVSVCQLTRYKLLQIFRDKFYNPRGLRCSLLTFTRWRCCQQWRHSGVE